MTKESACLYVVVGLPGAGKTTHARRLAVQHRAVRLNADEWMSDLGVDLFDERCRDRLEQRLIGIAGDILAYAGSVVIEFGSWSRAERDQLLTIGRDRGAHVELHVCDLSIDELWCRLSRRNAQPGATAINRETLDSYLPQWELPTPEELSHYNRHVLVGDDYSVPEGQDP